MITHCAPNRGGIAHYSACLIDQLSKITSVELVSFARLSPRFLFKGGKGTEPTFFPMLKAPVYRVLKYYNPATWMHAFSLIKNKIDPDLIHIQWVSPFLAPPYFFLLLLNRLTCNKPVVLTCHNVLPHERTPFDRILSWMVFTQASAFIVHAGKSKEQLISLFGIDPRRIFVIPHGNYAFFRRWSKCSAEDAKRILAVVGNKVILFFGYVRPFKGLIYLIRAMKSVIDEEPKSVLLIVGEMWESKDKYVKEIGRLKIEEHVKFFSRYIPDSQVHLFFEAADVVVLPYVDATQSGPMHIAMAFSKPVIATAVGGIPETLSDYEIGLLAPPKDVEQLSLAILRVLKNEIPFREIDKNAKERLKDNLDWSRIARRHHQVYLEVAIEESNSSS